MQQNFTLQSRMMALNVLRMMRPHVAIGKTKIRVGRQFDGGYVMIDDFDNVKVAYSLGINDDVSWDLEFARRNVDIYQYDHTIESLPHENQFFHWKKVGISGRSDPNQTMASLEDLISQNGHSDRTDMVLKCDIEGAEWEVLREVPTTVLRQFSQIVLEVHNFDFLNHSDHAENVRAAVANLTAHHRVVHVHGNNFAPWSIVGGIPVPNVMELSLARCGDYDFSPSDEVFPGPLDMPCWSAQADMHLGRFEF